MEHVRALGARLAAGGLAGRLTGKLVVVEQLSVRVGALLAEGGGGAVYRCVDAATGAVFALKHLCPGSSQEALSVCTMEVEVNALLAAHPGAVHMLAATPRPPQLGADAYLVLELCGPSLAQHLASHGPLTEDGALAVCRIVTAVLVTLHGRGVWHWDVKPENLLRTTSSWRVCDFGSASRRPAAPARPEERGALEDSIRRRTTPAYRAPEMWDLAAPSAVLGPAADIWALGCLLGAVLGAPPFCAEDKLRILAGTFTPPRFASLALAALEAQLLQVDPLQRPTAAQVLASIDALLEPLPPPRQEPAPPAAPAPEWQAQFDGA